MPIYGLQVRMRELGRVRLGEKGPKGEPKRRETFRFTTASERLARDVAAVFGGEAEPWPDAPDGEGYWQVSTDAREIQIILPPVFSDKDGEPTVPYSQWFELWSGGGCQRRCDGVIEQLSNSSCLCAAQVREEGEEARECKVVTRVSFMIPELPDLGVWRLDSHGWNAASELPGTLQVLVQAASASAFLPAVVRIEQRTKKVPGQGTRRFVVPVIELPSVTLNQLASGDVPLALNAPGGSPPPRPAIPPGPALPPDAVFDTDPAVIAGDDDVPFGPAPELTHVEPVDPLQAKRDELVALHETLGSDMEKVRALIEKRGDDERWLNDQMKRAREFAEQVESETAKDESGPADESFFQQQAEKAQKTTTRRRRTRG